MKKVSSRISSSSSSYLSPSERNTAMMMKQPTVIVIMLACCLAASQFRNLFKFFEQTRFTTPTEMFRPVLAIGNVDDDKHLIPRILHFVDLSAGFPKPLDKTGTNTTSNATSQTDRNIQAWRDLLEPLGWRIMVWDNAAVEQEFPADVPFLQKLSVYSWMSNLLRYKVLYNYGGIYVDTDVVPLRSLEPLRHQNFSVCEAPVPSVDDIPQGSTGYTISKAKCTMLCNAVIGVTRQHPVLNAVQQTAMSNSFDAVVQNRKYNIGISGPKAWTPHVKNDDTMHVLHAKTFFPCTWQKTDACILENFREQNYTFAMHQWSKSWAKKRDLE